MVAVIIDEELAVTSLTLVKVAKVTVRLGASDSIDLASWTLVSIVAASPIVGLKINDQIGSLKKK